MAFPSHVSQPPTGMQYVAGHFVQALQQIPTNPPLPNPISEEKPNDHGRRASYYRNHPQEFRPKNTGPETFQTDAEDEATRSHKASGASNPSTMAPNLPGSHSMPSPGGFSISGVNESLYGSFVSHSHQSQIPPPQNLDHTSSYLSVPGSVITYQQPANWGYNNAPPPSTISSSYTPHPEVGGQTHQLFNDSIAPGYGSQHPPSLIGTGDGSQYPSSGFVTENGGWHPPSAITTGDGSQYGPSSDIVTPPQGGWGWSPASGNMYDQAF